MTPKGDYMKDEKPLAFVFVKPEDRNLLYFIPTLAVKYKTKLNFLWVDW